MRRPPSPLWFLPLLSSACAGLPDVRELVPLDRVSPVPTQVAALGTSLEVGQRLRYSVAWQLPGDAGAGDFAVELLAVGVPEGVAERGPDADTLLELVQDWNTFGVGPRVELTDDGYTGVAVAGSHRLRVTAAFGEGEPVAREVDLPLALTGGGLTHFHAVLAGAAVGDCIRLSGDALAACLRESAGLIAILADAAPVLGPMDRMPAQRLVELPGVFRFLFTRRRLQFPLWQAEVAADGRLRVPFALTFGGQPALLGLLEAVEPSGMLRLTGGLVGLRIQHPSDPEAWFELKLVACEAAASGPSKTP